MAKEDLKIAERTQYIEERQPSIQVNFEALVPFEREVIKLMVISTPLTAYEIFTNLIMSKYCSLLDERKIAMIKMNGKQLQPSEQADAFISKNGAEKAASTLNRDFNVDLASYKTVQRLCADFAAIGWFGKRKLGKKAYYYLEKTTKAHLKKEFPAEFSV